MHTGSPTAPDPNTLFLWEPRSAEFIGGLVPVSYVTMEVLPHVTDQETGLERLRSSQGLDIKLSSFPVSEFFLHGNLWLLTPAFYIESIES